MSIKDIVKKIKWDDIFIVTVIILICSASFGSFKLYALSQNRGEIQIKPSSIPIQEAYKNKLAESPKGLLVASKTGKKYHFPTCSGALRISEANKIWFQSYEDAQKAGYTPAANCKGLE